MTKNLLRIVPLAMAMLGLAGSASQTSAQELAVGDRAPEFKLPGTDGRTYALSELKGKTVVLAWFPRAFSAG